MRRGALGMAAILLAAACSSSSTGAARPTPTPSPAAVRVITGTIGAAPYAIDVPQSWNGTLFLYSHGYASPNGTVTAAEPAPDSITRQWLLADGDALAASAFSSTGWAIADALRDQVALLDYFAAHVGPPKRVIAWGGSLGGIITAGLVQDYPGRFAAALPLCGVLAGGVASWNTGLDGAYAFKTLLAPASNIQLVHITNPTANLQAAAEALNQVSPTPAGRARLALVAALTDLPGWFLPTAPEPQPTDYSARVAAQTEWALRIDFPFEFANRAELEKRAGGNPSWNVGVDYAHQLAISPDNAEVVALYKVAGLDLAADLRTLSAGANIKPDPAAVAYLDSNISFDGAISVPVLTMHTTGDGLVVSQDESAYLDVVRRAGGGELLRQTFVHRAGHCAFTSAEVIAALKVLLKRLDSGAWDDLALTPAAMNASALGLGQAANSIGGFFPASPAFADFAPGPYPRPFPKGSPVPA